MEEVWISCKEPHILYEVSNLGKVRNKKTKMIKKTRINKGGYECVSLVVEDKVNGGVRVHRLVATAFLENEDINLPLSVDHIDRNKQNNAVVNLQWANANKQAENRTQTKARKGYGHIPILQFDLQGNFLKEYKNMHEILQELGICKENIFRACQKPGRTTHGYIFKYKPEDVIDGEIWRESVVNNITLSISSKGRIKRDNKLYKGQDHPFGYKFVSVGGKNYMIHRLVAEIFIPNVENKEIVNHKDSNRQNNSVGNLEWATRSENAIHFYKNNGSRLCKRVEQLDPDMNVVKVFDSLADAAKSLNTTRISIRLRINNGKMFHGYYWRWYVEPSP